MNPEPLTPLVKRDDDPFERALPRAGQRERAPRGADRRLLTALGVGVGAGGALSAFFGKYAAKIGAKGLLATIAVSVTAAAIATWSASSSVDTTEPSTNAVPAPVVTAPSPASASPELRVEALPSTRVEDLPSSPPATKPAGKAGSSAPATSASSAAAEAAPDLAREVELVQGARSALTRGEASEALRILDVHDREFPTGTLRPESRVLRIEALVRAGGERNVARANTLGDAFLAEHSGGPQARRVRAVLGRDR